MLADALQSQTVISTKYRSLPTKLVGVSHPFSYLTANGKGWQYNTSNCQGGGTLVFSGESTGNSVSCGFSPWFYVSNSLHGTDKRSSLGLYKLFCSSATCLLADITHIVFTPFSRPCSPFCEFFYFICFYCSVKS